MTNHNKRRVFWFTIGIASTIMVETLFGAIASGAQNPEPDRIAYISEESPTIWDLAIQEFPNKDTRKIVGQIKKLNNIELGRVQLGQAIKLPRG